MPVGAITGYVDLAQILLYAFWLFFAGLIYYLVREGHREGYPLETEGLSKASVTGWPIPSPKTYKLHGGGEVTIPDPRKLEPPLVAVSTGGIGAPIEPTGDPMLDGIGAGAWANRADVPDMSTHGEPLIQPLRTAAGFSVAKQDSDPRGKPVIAGDGKPAGTVVDLWVDTAEMMFRYLEVETNGGRRVLLPVPFARIRRSAIEVNSIYAHHFASVPATRNPDQVTLAEEDRISAFYGGGTQFASAKRSEPLL